MYDGTVVNWLQRGMMGAMAGPTTVEPVADTVRVTTRSGSVTVIGEDRPDVVAERGAESVTSGDLVSSWSRPTSPTRSMTRPETTCFRSSAPS